MGSSAAAPKRQELLTPRYGYGFQIGDCFAGPGWVGHDSGFPGAEAFVSYDLATAMR